MYGIYGDVVNAAEKALKDFPQTEELLEYPEVQADKAYYLSVLTKYETLRALSDKLCALKKAVEEGEELSYLLTGELEAGDREALAEEISACKRAASAYAAELSSALGCKRIRERVFARFKFGARSRALGAAFYASLRSELLARGVKLEGEKEERTREGILRGNSFFAEGEDALSLLSLFAGAHRVSVAEERSEELGVAVTPATRLDDLSEKDVRIDLFHSNGAGGQNVNKVETAVRATHIPTGITVTCQDERSQLKNRNRALERLEKRVREALESAERERMEAEIRATFKRKNTPISFDFVRGTMTDTRLDGFTRIPFPLSDFSSYMNRLVAL